MINKKIFKLAKQKKSFLSKLYDILNNSTYKDIIYWNKDGKSIIITNVNKFSAMILPKYYTHSNYSSFVRQLNKYGFHKSKRVINEDESYEHDKLNKNSSIDDINQCLKKKKKRNLLMKLLNKHSKDNFNNTFEQNNLDDKTNILKFLFEQNNNSIKIN